MRKETKQMEKYLKQDPLVTAASNTQTRILEGNNIGVFGQTSTGKSTLINSLLARNAAATGAGETTQDITPYAGCGFRVWDVPGRNDTTTYEQEKYVSLLKGLRHRLILVQSTVKENRKLMQLLDDLKLHYNIVVNKFDLIDDEEQEAFRNQIQHEIRSLGLKRMRQVFYISAKYPNRFRDDWLKMVDYLTK